MRRQAREAQDSLRRIGVLLACRRASRLGCIRRTRWLLCAGDEIGEQRPLSEDLRRAMNNLLKQLGQPGLAHLKSAT